jgi:hypothetical protein
MTLREQIIDRFSEMDLEASPTQKDIDNYILSINHLEKIADDFAIGFAEWISYKYKYLDNKGWFATTYHLEMGIFKTSEELLEIYKKDKGL